VQFVPQPPQVEMFERSASQPLEATPSQSSKSASHALMKQPPATQSAVAFGSAQVEPQPPQFVALV
jgi:hypothetical protein